MRKTATTIVLTLVLGIVTLAKPHPHHQDVLQGKVGDASPTDLWRHYLLHVASLELSTAPDSREWIDRQFIVARKFRAEFEKAIDDFNAAQENRVETDQIVALKSFIKQRDAMVESYKNELLSKLDDQQARTVFERDQVLARRPLIKSLMNSSGDPAAGKKCGLPHSITCSITYSAERIDRRGHNADGSINTGYIQVIDGVAVMAGNPQHARHTPTVTFTVNDQPRSVSGKSVCADCYLYVNEYIPFAVAVGVQYKIAIEGVVACSEAGKFYDATWGRE